MALVLPFEAAVARAALDQVSDRPPDGAEAFDVALADAGRARSRLDVAPAARRATSRQGEQLDDSDSALDRTRDPRPTDPNRLPDDAASAARPVRGTGRRSAAEDPPADDPPAADTVPTPPAVANVANPPTQPAGGQAGSSSSASSGAAGGGLASVGVAALAAIAASESVDTVQASGTSAAAIAGSGIQGAPGDASASLPSAAAATASTANGTGAQAQTTANQPATKPESAGPAVPAASGMIEPLLGRTGPARAAWIAADLSAAASSRESAVPAASAAGASAQAGASGGGRTLPAAGAAGPSAASPQPTGTSGDAPTTAPIAVDATAGVDAAIAASMASATATGIESVPSANGAGIAAAQNAEAQAAAQDAAQAAVLSAAAAQPATRGARSTVAGAQRSADGGSPTTQPASAAVPVAPATGSTAAGSGSGAGAGGGSESDASGGSAAPAVAPGAGPSGAAVTAPAQRQPTDGVTAAAPAADPDRLARAADLIVSRVVQRLHAFGGEPGLEARLHHPELGELRLTVTGRAGDTVRAEIVARDEATAAALARSVDRFEHSGGDLSGIQLQVRADTSGLSSQPGGLPWGGDSGSVLDTPQRPLQASGTPGSAGTGADAAGRPSAVPGHALDILA